MSTITDNHLAHHGIQGMHWGIRRYQNYDGTLKKAGRGRGDDPDQNGKNGKGKTGQSKTRSVSEMSNAEIKSRIARAKAEEEYKKYYPEQEKAGKKFANSMRDSVLKGVSAGTETVARKAVEKMGDKLLKEVFGESDSFNYKELSKKPLDDLSYEEAEKMSKHTSYLKNIKDKQKDLGARNVEVEVVIETPSGQEYVNNGMNYLMKRR